MLTLFRTKDNAVHAGLFQPQLLLKVLILSNQVTLSNLLSNNSLTALHKMQAAMVVWNT
jgi:hypothetical protein